MEIGLVEAICGLFSVADARTISIGLEGLDNMLKKGKEVNGANPVAVKLDECGGLKQLE